MRAAGPATHTSGRGSSRSASRWWTSCRLRRAICSRRTVAWPQTRMRQSPVP